MHSEYKTYSGSAKKKNTEQGKSTVMMLVTSMPAVCAGQKVPVNKHGLNWKDQFSCVKSGERKAVGFQGEVLDLSQPV